MRHSRRPGHGCPEDEPTSGRRQSQPRRPWEEQRYAGLLVFSLGLSMTVSPLTATVFADADDGDTGIASAINNGVARVAGLIAVPVIGVVVAGTLVGRTFGPNESSVRAFHEAIVACSALVAPVASSAYSESSIRGARSRRRNARATNSSERPSRPRQRPLADGSRPRGMLPRAVEDQRLRIERTMFESRRTRADRVITIGASLPFDVGSLTRCPAAARSGQAVPHVPRRRATRFPRSAHGRRPGRVSRSR
jgi:hypothetical protein